MRKTILAVDDEESVINLLEKVLTRQGFEFLEAVNGKKAVKAAHAKKPDLILLDIEMNGMDGPQTPLELKRDPKTREIPVIMLTGRGDREDIDAAIRNYADKNITKPFEIRDLTEQICKTLRVADPSERAGANA